MSLIMGQSKVLKEIFRKFTDEEFDRLVRMGWEDRSTFEAIEKQFGLSPNQFIQFMRFALPRNDFERWRRRTHEQGQLKHGKKRGFSTTRFKCSRQSVDGITKGWK